MKLTRDSVIQSVIAFNQTMPDDPCTVDECKDVLKRALPLWEDVVDTELNTPSNDEMPIIYMLANVGGSVISCIRNGGKVSIDVDRLKR